LTEKLDPLLEAEEEDFDEIPGFSGEIKKLLDKSVVLICEGHGEILLPYSQLRELSGDVYASRWILEQRHLL
jgi:hypothetical protein